MWQIGFTIIKKIKYLVKLKYEKVWQLIKIMYPSFFTVKLLNLKIFTGLYLFYLTILKSHWVINSFNYNFVDYKSHLNKINLLAKFENIWGKCCEKDQIVKKFFFEIINILDQMIKFTSISLMKKFLIKFPIWSLFAALTPY